MTGLSPLFGKYCFHPRMTFIQHPVQNCNDIRGVNAGNLSQKMNVIFAQKQTVISLAQSIEAQQAHKPRWEGVKINVVDRVWMDARNISTHRPSKKLHCKHLGPYEISVLICPWAYWLDPPMVLHINPVEPISHLSEVLDDPLPGQIEPVPLAGIVNGEEEYEVKRIEDYRLSQCQLQYLVEWPGYDKRSWEPAVIIDGL
jgi:hypothetical protein